MSEVAAARFSCEACNKTYAWKPELAGKRVKCKCGQAMTVPEASPAQDEPDDLYDLAPSDEPQKPKRPPIQPVPAMGAAGAKASKKSSGASSAIAAYASAPTRRDPMAATSLMDMQRDVYAPVALLAAGVIAYLACFAFKYHLSGYGIAVTGIGLFVMALIKATLMIGFALVLAAPLGVSFGGIWTAALKLGAIAVFADGITSWVDLGVAKMSGGAFGGGIMGYGVMSLPVALAIYWVLLIYLFSMDSGDSWTVVILLSVFDMIVKMAMVFTVLSMVLNMGGVHAPGISTGSTHKMSNASDLTTHVEELQEYKLLKEARVYIAEGHQGIFAEPTEAWYKAGAKNVWFAVARDINGKTTPEGVIVEMPEEKDKRQQCLQIRKDFYEKQKMGAADLTDDEEQYMEVRLR